jgi:hypothetical protein
MHGIPKWGSGLNEPLELWNFLFKFIALQVIKAAGIRYLGNNIVYKKTLTRLK